MNDAGAKRGCGKQLGRLLFGKQKPWIQEVCRVEAWAYERRALVL